MGLTPQGYTSPNLEEVVNNLSDNAKGLYGQLMDTSRDSLMGHFIGVSSVEIIEIFEDIAELYANLNPNTSEGRMLDNISLFGGLVRQDISFSTGNVLFSGTEGTVIPQDAQLHPSGDTERLFRVVESRTITGAGSVLVPVIALKVGDVKAPKGTLDTLVNDIVGVTLTNPMDIDFGRSEVESDDSFRARRNATISVGGNGTVAALSAAIGEIAGVTTSRIIHNPTTYYRPRGDGVRLTPPNSVECVVEGGSDADIIETIALVKSSGTEAYGLLMALYEDIEGNAHQIRFSRPDLIPVDIQVSYRIYSEELFPVDGEEQIRQAILKFANVEYVLGKDVLRDRLYAPCFTVQGISNVEISVNSDLVPVDSFSGNIKMNPFQRATIQSSDISLVKLTTIT